MTDLDFDAPYDPDQRRDTPLARRLVAEIERSGPMRLDRFVARCLYDQHDGYYRSKPVIGAGGDFVTAPEISQVFGELVGAWAAVVWTQMGSPASLALVELGPGRGTMMNDMLRVMTRVPGLREALSVRLVEPSERLRAVQAARLAGCGVAVEHADIEQLPEVPTILVANEVVDCLPVRQWVWSDGADGTPGWRERTVELAADGQLSFGLDGNHAANVPAAASLSAPALGDVLEHRDCGSLTRQLGLLASRAPLAALLVDYGHTEPGYGDTVQAVRAQRFEHPLTSPGEADVTAQVDFAALIDELHALTPCRLAIDVPVTQAELLGALGAIERTSRLMAANPDRAGAIEAGTIRLLAPNGMGTRFKALGVRSVTLPPLPGFPLTVQRPTSG